MAEHHPESRACKQCGKQFTPAKHLRSKGHGLFCSLSCSARANCCFTNSGPLAKVTRDDLLPVWSRMDISTQKIADALGVTRSGLSFHARVKLGLPSRAGNYRPLTKCSDVEFARLWMAGVPAKEIARRLGYHKERAITARRKALGLPARVRGKNTGNRGGWQRPTAEDLMIQMIRLHEQQPKQH